MAKKIYRGFLAHSEDVYHCVWRIKMMAPIHFKLKLQPGKILFFLNSVLWMTFMCRHKLWNSELQKSIKQNTSLRHGKTKRTLRPACFRPGVSGLNSQMASAEVQPDVAINSGPAEDIYRAFLDPDWKIWCNDSECSIRLISRRLLILFWHFTCIFWFSP